MTARDNLVRLFATAGWWAGCGFLVCVVFALVELPFKNTPIPPQLSLLVWPAILGMIGAAHATRLQDVPELAVMLALLNALTYGVLGLLWGLGRVRKWMRAIPLAVIGLWVCFMAFIMISPHLP